MNKRIYILIVFVLLFFIGLLNIKNVGVYNDEASEQEILRMNIREYAELSSYGDDVVTYYENNGIIPISSSIERDHGISAYYLFSPFLPIGNISPKLLSILWHSYTYLIFFAGVIILYFICKELFHSKKLSLLASCMYFLSPRIFADGLYNNKDIVLLTLTLYCLFFGIKLIKNKNLKNAILFGIFGAFATNTRIVGVFIFGICGLFYLVEVINECIKDKKVNTKIILYGFAAIISMMIVYIIITPSIWGAGKIDLIGHLNWSLRESTKFSRWNGTVLFEGHNYVYAKNDFLPVHYLPKMILITTPIYVTISFFVGVAYLIYNIVKKGVEDSKYLILIALCAFIPFFIALVTHTKLYNGWRHFYFLYGFIIIISAYGIYNVCNYKKIKKFIYVIIGISLIFNMGVILKYGINNTAYYNRIISHKNIGKNYELDYYGVSTKHLLEQAIKNKKQDIVYICYDISNYGIHVLNYNYGALSLAEKQQILIIYSRDEYEKLLSEGKEVYMYYNNTYSENVDINNSKVIYKETSLNDIVSALYQ